jgi:hypothetical protein
VSADPTPTMPCVSTSTSASTTRHPLGTVYLFHFAQRYEHAGHYTGWAEDLDHRVAEHLSGRGARLIQVITQAGIGFRLARTWPGVTRARERQLKRQGGASRHCPICQEDRKARGLLRRPTRDQSAGSNQQPPSPWTAAVPGPGHPPGPSRRVHSPQPRVRPARAGVAGQTMGRGPQPRGGWIAWSPGHRRCLGRERPALPAPGCHRHQPGRPGPRPSPPATK